MKRVEEGAGELVVSRGDSAVDLQVTDHALDAVALAIHAPVPADFGLAIGFGRNAGTDAGLIQAGADGVGIVALVGEKICVPFYKYHGELAGFAAYKNHVSFGFGAAVLQSKDRKMLEKKGYITGKGTMQIKFDQKVPTTAIKQIQKAKQK